MPIETEHVAKFMGHKIEEEHPSPQRSRPGLCAPLPESRLHKVFDKTPWKYNVS